MGKNALGETTVMVIAKRRLSYYDKVATPGTRFEADERQARAWEKTGAASIVQERPKFKAEPAPRVDPVLAKVLTTENPTLHHTPTPHPSVSEFVAASEAAPEPAAATEPDTDTNGATAATSHSPSRYSRRDLRAKP